MILSFCLFDKSSSNLLKNKGCLANITKLDFLYIAEEPKLKPGEKIKMFLGVHWKGLVCIFGPIICSGVLRPFPPENHQWSIYCILIMVIFWTTECIPVPRTSLLPLAIFPLTGMMNSSKVCSFFMNDTIFMFIGSLILAASIEQSGLHKRMAFIVIRSFGYSHVKLLVAIVVITSFVSMWITSNAATTMMVPFIFAVLKSFEDQKFIKMYDVPKDGGKVASDISTCYFCTASFAATIGNSASLIGSVNNLTFKDYFASKLPKAPQYITFPLFSAFTFPLLIVLDTFMILYMLVVYIGVWRPKSSAAKQAKISADGLHAAEAAVSRGYDALGPVSFWEFMVIILFSGALIALFFRTPIIFIGQADAVINFLCSLAFQKTIKNIFHEGLPKESIPSVLNWKNVMAKLPFSIMFIMGSGFSIAGVWKKGPLRRYKIMRGTQLFSDEVNLLFVIVIVTMIANVSSTTYTVSICTQAAMNAAKVYQRNSLWYGLAAALSSNYCFMLPGSANNAIVQRAAKIPTMKMIKAGLGPTISTIFITWLALYFYGPIVWPVLKEKYPPWNKYWAV